MPSKSEAQQKLMGQAWAVRKGELERSKVSKEVLEIADSDMSDADLKAFASTKHKGLPEYVKEQLNIDESATLFIDMKKYAASWMRQAWNYKDMYGVLVSVLDGMQRELEGRENHPNISSKESKDSERMNELLLDILNQVEKKK